MSHKELASAKAEDWVLVDTQEKERQRFLQDALTNPISEEDSLFIKNQLIEIKSIEQEILKLAEAAKTNTMDTISQTQQSNKAIKAYKQQP